MAAAVTGVAACSDKGGSTVSQATGSASGSASSAGTIKVGVYGPAGQPQGMDSRDGAMLAADELNAAGKGPKVEIVFCDSGASEPEKAVACITQFAQTDKVQAITGGASSAETLAAVDQVVRVKLPYVSSGAASPDVVKGVDATGDRKYVFRIGPLNTTSLAADLCLNTVTQITTATGYTKFGILYEDSVFGNGLNDFLSKCLATPSAATAGKIPIEKGVEVVSSQKHASTATTFETQFKAFTDAGAQYVIEANATPVGIAVGKYWGTTKPAFALGGINVLGQSGQYFSATGGVVAGELNGPAGVARVAISPKTIPFFDAFKAKYGRDPVYTGPSTYDAVYAVQEAATRAGATTADAIVTELATTNRIGAQGTEIFTDTHDITYSPTDPTKGLQALYNQYQADGTKKVVFPANVAEATYAKPSFAP